MSLRTRAAAVAVLAAAPLLVLASPAFAHAGLVSTTPAADSVVTTSPANVVLTFDEPVLDQGAGILVTDSAGTHYEQADTLHYGGATISVRLDPLGAAGEYTVAWRVVADDGDPQSQTYTFTYQPSGSSAEPGASDATAGTTTSPTASSAETTTSGSGGSAALWVVLAVVLVLVIMGFIVVVRRGRGSSDSSD